jgi:CDP-glycerol glycerophosphotransferase (TagB/SpsB family)
VYFQVLARAKYLVNNAHFADYVVKRKGTVHLQTHHGTPLKYMGMDGLTHNGRDGQGGDRLRERVAMWDFSLAANPHTTAAWRTAYPGEWESLEYGYPRNDVLVNAAPEHGRRVREALGIPDGQRVILYAPTHRGSDSRRFVGYLDIEALAKALGDDTVILLRTHYFYDKLAPKRTEGAKVIEVTEYPVVEDLYLAADLLITDYSSAMFDYAVLDRPIVVYASDWEKYSTTRGVYFDIFESSPGVVVTNLDDLLARFADGSVDDPQARQRFRERFCALEDGRASERVVRRVLLGETAAAQREVKIPTQAAAPAQVLPVTP